MSVVDSLHRIASDQNNLERPASSGAAASRKQAGVDDFAARDNERFRVERRGLPEMADIVPDWRDLARRAFEPNVFYEPEFALAAASAFGADVEALLVWSRRVPARLVGFFPFQVARRRYGLFPPVLVGWTHPYAPFGVPLADRDDAEAIIATAFDCLAESPDVPNLVLLPLTPTDGRWAGALASVLVRRGGHMALFGQHKRALLAPPRDRSSYLNRAVSPRKRKELRRQARRLSDHGDVVVSHALTPETIEPALEIFMQLEAQGWKGRAGGAAAMHADLDAFMRGAVSGLAMHGSVQIVQLAVDERPIAAGIVLRSGDHAWFWKIAYDESVARASPGVQLTLELTRALLDDETLTQTDSCATAGHPMIDRLWHERLELADHLLQIGPGGKTRFTLACHFETLRRAVFGVAKRVRDRWCG